MNSRIRLLAVIGILLFTASACSKQIDGSGNITRESRSVSPFLGIENNAGIFHIVIRRSNEYAIDLEGEDNILPLVETIVQNGILKIKLREDHSPVSNKPVIVRLQVPALTQVVSRGEGIIESSDEWTAETMLINSTGNSKIRLSAKTKRLKLFLSGAGDVRLTGTCDKAEFTIHGSGTVASFDLQSKQATANISGSGQAEVHIADELVVSISGNGTLFYRGNPPMLKSEVAGNGKLIQVRL